MTHEKSQGAMLEETPGWVESNQHLDVSRRHSNLFGTELASRKPDDYGYGGRLTHFDFRPEDLQQPGKH
ncbi:hypothetical protein ACRE_081000 [Hapsidospora chrysogenum ATCC 11550]|uniref:Uncharacterized protein n=1 Tax=Hapsidospora chrysogenum (strain ATCC 11550 / CBS 779.69 / DSM 880 / IAM 14645 / JCM 23072 / IMI 49137) TaxID=857340 RepID=A0A086SVR6_HAPC1|nr:hypothetical protein ACRE_081000 [Hapsidospora chrysogenum ATCC 11550]